jgi:hypothetical protein
MTRLRAAFEWGLNYPDDIPAPSPVQTVEPIVEEPILFLVDEGVVKGLFKRERIGFVREKG